MKGVTMATCKECGNRYEDKRAKLGYETCLECGEEEAQMELQNKRKRIAILYNKGPYMLLSERDLIGLGKK